MNLWLIGKYSRNSLSEFVTNSFLEFLIRYGNKLIYCLFRHGVHVVLIIIAHLAALLLAEEEITLIRHVGITVDGCIRDHSAVFIYADRKRSYKKGLARFGGLGRRQGAIIPICDAHGQKFLPMFLVFCDHAAGNSRWPSILIV